MPPFVSRVALALVGLFAAFAPPLSAQDTGTPLPAGTPAPDFALIGASAEGVLGDSIRPTDFRGQTLVIAFFFRARSSG